MTGAVGGGRWMARTADGSLFASEPLTELWVRKDIGDQAVDAGASPNIHHTFTGAPLAETERVTGSGEALDASSGMPINHAS